VGIISEGYFYLVDISYASIPDKSRP
jgi:hypothetical protein